MGRRKVEDSEEKKLFRYIIEKFGGVLAVAKKLGTSKQVVSLWVKNGRVPFKEVGRVSEILDIPVCALNYEQLKTLPGYCKDFECVRKETLLSLREKQDAWVRSTRARL